MLEGVLERLLLHFLAPYVDGIDIETLRVGVFGGSLELKDLQFKKEVPALVGFEDFRVSRSRIGLIKLSIPWKALLRSEIRVVINVVELEVEHVASPGARKGGDEKVLEEMRSAKQQVVELRAQQLRELLRHQEEASQESEKQGSVAKIARKVLENLQLEFSDLNLALASKGQGFAWSLALPALSVLSADANFQTAVGAESRGEGSSLFKMLRLQQMGFKMSPAGCSDLSKAEYIITPISIDLNLAHVPRTGMLRLRLEVASRERVALRMVRSQLKSMLRIMAENSSEKERLCALLVPAHIESNVLGSDGGRAAQEAYYELHRKRVLSDRNLLDDQAGEPLAQDKERELALLEDVLPILFLARQRLKVMKEIEVLEKYRNERAKDAEKARGGFFSRMLGRGKAGAAGDVGARAPLMTEEERDAFMQAVHDSSSVEEIELPRKYKFELALGTTSLDLVDDRSKVESMRQVLSASLDGIKLGVDVAMKADHKGNDSAEWRIEMQYLPLSAKQRGRDLITVKEEPGSKDDGFVAHMVVESLLQAQRNLLKLSLVTKPLEMNWQPAFYEPILEFLRAPQVEGAAASPGAAGAGAASGQSPAKAASPSASPEAAGTGAPRRPGFSRYDSIVDLSSQLLQRYGDSAKTAAVAVYERLPDATSLEVRLASPLFRVPVEGRGTATISLGHLVLATPSPCASGTMSFIIDLTSTMISATSLRGERFDLLRPVPIGLRFTNAASATGSKMDLQITMEEMSLTLAPQAMHILLAVPDAFTTAPESSESDAAASAQAAAASGQEAEGGGVVAGAGRLVQELAAAAASSAAGGGGGAAAAEGAVDGEGEGDGAKVLAEALDAAKRKVQQVSEMSLDVNIGLAAKRFEVTLSDSIVPVLCLHTDLFGEGVTVRYSKSPKKVEVGLEHAMLEVQLLNPRHGRWEPLFERFDFSMLYSQHVDQQGVSDSHIVLSGYGPFVLNVTPTAVRIVGWYLPLLSAGLRGARDGEEEQEEKKKLEDDPASGSPHAASSPTATQRAVVDGRGACAEAAKYRVINLCEETLVVRLRSSLKSELTVEGPPTGSEWISLDDLILPNFADALVVRSWRQGATESSPLHIDRGTGAVSVPGVEGTFAEWLTPHPSHRLLLLGSGLRVHNRTDLPLLVRFHAQGHEELVTSGGLGASAVCDGALLGLAPATCRARSFASRPGASALEASAAAALACAGGGEQGLLLAPNAVCAVPGSMLEDDGGAWLSLRPGSVAGASFCAPFASGGGSGASEPKAIVCGGASAANNEDPVGFVSFAAAYETPAPARARISTVVVQPVLTLVNALPISDITVSLSSSERPADWRSVEVPRMERFNVYHIPGAVAAVAGEVRVRVRFDEFAPWTEVAGFRRAALAFAAASPGAPEPQEVELRRQTNAGAAGAVVAHAGPFMLRVECPNWLSDRSGVAGGQALQVRHRGAALPSAEGITLLPSKCMEEDCELHLCAAAAAGGSRSSTAASSICSQRFRAPAGWGMLSLPAPSGSLRLCLQSEAVAAHDVLGARSQVIWLRPRLVLTNNADVPIDVRASAQGSPESLIKPGESIEWHWQAKKGGGDDANSTELRFRPRVSSSSPWRWSPAIAVSDQAVGSTSLMLLPESGPVGSDSVIWSADVSGASGALSVAFRPGSDFVAVNGAVRSQVRLCVRPSGAPRNIDVVPGAEACYGWVAPEKTRAATVFLEPAPGSGAGAGAGGSRRFEISDVQTTMRHPFPLLGVELSVKRSGDRVLLCLEDSRQTLLAGAGGAESPGAGRAGASAEAPAGAGSSRMRLELKLPKLAVSLVEELPAPRELLFMQFQLIRVELARTENDTQVLRLAVSEAQVDCQLPGRLDGSNRDGQNSDSERLGIVGKGKAAVLLANRAGGSRPFLALDVTRVSTSSRDFLLPSVSLAIDAVDATLDDEFLEHLRLFIHQATTVSNDQLRSLGAGGVALARVLRFSGTSILKGYSAPPLPSVIQLEKMQISAIDLTLWCSLALRNLAFLSPTMRTAVMILSLSGKITLDGAQLRLEERSLPAHRGSTREFVSGLASQYTMDLMSQSAQLLGRSSLANVPRVPLRIGGTGLSFIGETVTLGMDEASRLLEQLTFDDDYIQRQQSIRKGKRIRGVTDGMVEAGAALGQGVAGITDVFTKPVEGFSEGGVGGFFKGVGQGLTGALFKPVNGVGQAFSSVGQGITAQVGQFTGTNTTQSQRNEARLRSRLPRMLYSEQGALRTFSEFDAEVRRQLGRPCVEGAEVVLPLGGAGAGAEGSRKALLLFPTKLLVTEVKWTEGGNASSASARKSTASERSLLSQAMRPITLTATVAQVGLGGFDALGQGLVSTVEEDPGDPDVVRRAQEFVFSNLREVQQTGNVMQLQDASGRLTVLPLGAAGLGPAASAALLAGFRSSLAGPAAGAPAPGASPLAARGVADWAPFVAALQEEERRSAVPHELDASASAALPAAAASSSSSAAAGAAGAGARASEFLGDADGVVSSPSRGKVAGGSHILEVFELQARIIGTWSWSTPYMPTDFESSWRWADANGMRHPNLRDGISKAEAVASDVPPCELRMYQPRGSWKLTIASGTDVEGWMYAVHWNASTWNKSAGMFDAVRKRRWTREFC